jgi:phosphoribosylformylglycinamidine cyclo-ligase
MKSITYKTAGVDIDKANALVADYRRFSKSTHSKGVINDIGSFGGFFRPEMRRFRDPVLVSSTDGVGTKLKIAFLADRHDTVGIDLVAMSANDILCSGAEGLFFLDYISTGKIRPGALKDIVKGIARGCKEAGYALIGGETAEMPGMYRSADYDLAGFIVGVVEKDDAISGEKITEGDSIIGLASSGLHTNGYSLVRRLFGIDRDALALKMIYPELGKTLGEELLAPHRCYFNDLKPYLQELHGIAHITGGGLVGNIPRILPQGCSVELDRASWTAPAIFDLIQKRGNIKDEEMFRVFNMGVGMIVLCDKDISDNILQTVEGAGVIGRVIKANGSETVIIR